MEAPSSQLRGFITRVVNPSQTLLGFVDVGMIESVSVQVPSVHYDADADADAVRRSA
jgi:hypothetical protein